MSQDEDPLRVVIPSIDPEVTDRGASLLFTAIGELAEEASADAVMMRDGDHTVWVMRADKLQEFGLDVSALAKAIEVLGRRREPPGKGPVAYREQADD